MDVKDYIAANRERFISEWASLIRIPSVSCEQEHKPDMLRCAERWRELLQAAGCQRAEVMPAPTNDGNPFVFAEYTPNNQIVNPPVVLVYAHYDVMPVAPLELWQSDPWEPSIRDGRLYARGADDDKGQAMIQAKAFEYLVHEGLMHGSADRQNCRVKFIFEGEEEIGSPSLAAFIEQNKDLLACDVILVSDTSMIGKDTPSLTVGLRGLAYWQIEVDGPNRDLHSGHFGGAVRNPINALTQMLAQVVDDKGRITIPTSSARRATPRWSVTVAGPRLTSAVYGAVTQAKDQKPYCPPRRLPKFPADLLPIRIMRPSAGRLPTICSPSHQPAYVSKSRLCMAARDTFARWICLPTRLPNTASNSRLANDRSLHDEEVVFLSSPSSNACSESKPFSWDSAWSRTLSTHPTSQWILTSGRKVS